MIIESDALTALETAIYKKDARAVHQLLNAASTKEINHFKIWPNGETTFSFNVGSTK